MKDTFGQLPLSAESLDTASVPPRSAKERDRGLGTASLAAFIAGSFLAHGVAYAALSSLPLRVAEAPAPQEITFTVLASADEPKPEPVAVPQPPGPAPRRVLPRAERAPVPRPAPAKAEPMPSVPEPAPIQTLGVSSDSGLAVAGTVGAPTAIAGTSVTGVLGGTGTGSATPAPSLPRLDLRKLTSEWASEVSRVINSRASREYPRSALRAHVQGSVVLSLRIGTNGKVEAVELARSSGFPQLDEAALAAARALGEVPAPPEALHRYLRPFPVPVNYVIR